MSESDEEVTYESADENEKLVTAEAEGAATQLQASSVSEKSEVASSGATEKLTDKPSQEAESSTDEKSELAPSVPAGDVKPAAEKQDTEPAPGGEKQVTSVLDRLAEDDTSKTNWGWSSLSSWGTNVLNTAATSVTTFTNQVGEGLYQVLETVESGLVEPDPEELGRSADTVTVEPAAESKTAETVVSQNMVRHGEANLSEGSEAAQVEKQEEEDQEKDQAPKEEGWLSGWHLPILSDVVQKTSSVVQQTVQQTTSVSKKVIGGGLDVLETIGRKTFDVLAEGDHGLKKTIEKTRDRPTLSQTLREAKELSEMKSKEEEAFLESRKSNFGAQFDEFQGLVQLEALESLNSTSESKVHGFIEMLPKDTTDPLKSELMNIKRIFDTVQENDDDEDVTEHDFNQLVSSYYGRLNVNASVQKLLTCQTKVRQLLSSCEQDLKEQSANVKTAKEIHEMAIQSLAEMTSCAIEHWHRVGLQLLVSNLSAQSSFHDIANELATLTKILSNELSLQSASFVGCLTLQGKDSTEASSSSTEFITSVYLESGNASSYIRNGFQLLLPVLQLAAIKAHPLFKDKEDSN